LTVGDYSVGGGDVAEGAGLGFPGKAATGLGAIVGGLVLDLVGFPNDRAHHTAAITEPVLARLMLAHGPLATVIALGAVAIFLPYAITRARHDEISGRLRLQRAAAFAPPGGVSPGA
jgi:GPH family glycoside/pentoside/hexuronide:cation symporter